MQLRRLFQVSILLIGSLLFAAACTSGGGGGDDSGGDAGNGGGTSGPVGERQLATDCGTVVEGELRNPVAEQDAELVTITENAGGNAVVVQRANGPQLVKIAGLSSFLTDFEQGRAEAVIAQFIGPALFYESEVDCAVNVGGAPGTSGALFREADGASLGEAIIRNAGADIDSSARCMQNELLPCYNALEEQNGIETGATVTRFLWKPVSERDGNLVVLISPRADRIVAGGETLTNFGPSNGFSQTSRSNRSGAAFGGNITLQAFDSSGRPLVFPGGELSINIPNGSSRLEF